MDNSNIFFGAWNSREPGVQDRTVRVDVGRLVSEIERKRDVGVRKVRAETCYVAAWVDIYVVKVAAIHVLLQLG